MSPLWVHNGSAELDHESRYKQIMAVSITLTVVMSIAVSLRAYVRTVMLKTLGADDWVIFVTAVRSPLPLRRFIGSLISKYWFLAM
jgi:hypothetical protein